MQKARFLPDDTPGDNSLELVFMLLGGPNGANWVDGTSKTLTITDLILCPREPEDAEKTYLEGEWRRRRKMKTNSPGERRISESCGGTTK